jgi:hypothetical protein
VFAAIGMFCAFGLVIWPVLMLVIVTTISVYLAVYKGVPLEPSEDEESKKDREKKGWLQRLTRRARRSEPAAPEPDADASKEEEEAAEAKPDAP